jgi:hypothetical protein
LAYLLALIGGALLLTMRQVDATLRQMHPLGEPGGGSLGFPLALTDPGRVQARADTWSAYQQASPVPATVASPRELILYLLLLDVGFILCYGGVLVVLYAVAQRLQQVGPDWMSALAGARARMLRAGLAGVPLLMFVDLLEDAALYLAYIHTWWPAQVAGPWLSLVKMLLLAFVAVPLVVAAVSVLTGWKVLGKTLASARAVLLVVITAATLLLFLPLGTEQVDDVVRAWSWGGGIAAAVTTLGAAALVLGAVRELTGGEPERLDPNGGDEEPQVLLLAAALAAAIAGICLLLVGFGRGLLVAAGMLLAIVIVGVGVPPGMQVAEGAKVAGASLRVLGNWLARLLSAGLCVVVLWVVVRAATFDLLVRVGPPRGEWMLLLAVVALVLAGAGWVFLCRPWRASGRGRLWRVATAVALVLLWGTLLPGDWTNIAAPLLGGTVAVLMIGVAAGAGGLSWVVVRIRRSSFTNQYRLPPALRLMNLSRFPAVGFVLVWALLVAMVTPGGFHDVQRGTQFGPAGPPPSLEEAYDAWLAAAERTAPGAPHPVVLVAAQGGGIRAAVWTALVMECLFGPGPVSDGEGICAHQGPFDPAAASEAVQADRLPVFLASGASGGSVGLAAWAARRVDLAEREPGWDAVPSRVDDLLPADYVAPNLARLLSGDVLYLLLAQERLADRAEILERSLERSWGAQTHGGLSRGLRASWQVANGSAGQWRIPVLAFNSSQVEDGCRLVSSPVDFLASSGPASAATVTGDDDQPSDMACSGANGPAVNVLPYSTELIDYLCPGEDVNLSTAAHLSARFPYVSPTGRVWARDCGPERGGAERKGLVPASSVSYAIDGGYFDNSGSATAVQAWRALEPLAAARERAGHGCVVPLFLQIDNSVDAGAGQATGSTPLELWAPAQALFSQLDARQSMESGEARSAFAATRSPAGRTVTDDGVPIADPAWFRIAPAPQPGLQPPLGWTLSASTVADMRRQLLSGENGKTIQKMVRLLDPTTKISCTAPEAARLPS